MWERIQGRLMLLWAEGKPPSPPLRGSGVRANSQCWASWKGLHWDHRGHGWTGRHKELVLGPGLMGLQPQVWHHGATDKSHVQASHESSMDHSLGSDPMHWLTSKDQEKVAARRWKDAWSLDDCLRSMCRRLGFQGENENGNTGLLCEASRFCGCFLNQLAYLINKHT